MTAERRLARAPGGGWTRHTHVSCPPLEQIAPRVRQEGLAARRAPARPLDGPSHAVRAAAASDPLAAAASSSSSARAVLGADDAARADERCEAAAAVNGVSSHLRL